MLFVTRLAFQVRNEQKEVKEIAAYEALQRAKSEKVNGIENGNKQK